MDDMSKALEPASSIIARFGGSEKVQAITGASRTRVYRWTQPENKGGTGGTIPQKQLRKLLEHAMATGIQIDAAELLGVAA